MPTDILVRLTDQQKAWLDHMAKQGDRSRSAQVRYLIQQAINAEDVSNSQRVERALLENWPILWGTTA